MKSSNYLLIYDDHCPLCRWYSKQFVQLGLLQENNRQPFSTVDQQWLDRINFETSRNRIPLINRESGEVLYGIDSLLRLLGLRWAWIEKTGHWPGVHWLLEKFYALISYNRKVVVAVKCGQHDIDCAPDFHIGYRLVFLLLLLLMGTGFTNFVWEGIQQYSNAALLQDRHWAGYGITLLALLLLRGLFFPSEKRLEFYGQCGMLFLFASFSLALWMALSSLLGPSFLLFIFGSGVTAVTLIGSYRKRMRFAGLRYALLNA